MKGMLQRLFRRPSYRVGQGMRGRVHKISIIAGGEVSIVIRCGMDEPRARQLVQGSLVEFFETREGIPTKESLEESARRWAEEEAARQAAGEPSGKPVGLLPERCVEVPWSGDGPLVELGKVSETGKVPPVAFDFDRQRRYEAAFTEIYGKAPDALTDSERKTTAVFEAHQSAVLRMEAEMQQTNEVKQ